MHEHFLFYGWVTRSVRKSGFIEERKDGWIEERNNGWIEEWENG